MRLEVRIVNSILRIELRIETRSLIVLRLCSPLVRGTNLEYQLWFEYRTSNLETSIMLTPFYSNA
jgi:hypothetical protein